MSLAAQQNDDWTMRLCGHRVPKGRKLCPWCKPPMLSVVPLQDELRRLAPSFGGYNKMAFHIASRLGMEYDNVERQIRKIMQGKMQRITLRIADEYSVALGQVPAILWADEWDAANPIEPYGDEGYAYD